MVHANRESEKDSVFYLQIQAGEQNGGVPTALPVETPRTAIESIGDAGLRAMLDAQAAHDGHDGLMKIPVAGTDGKLNTVLSIPDQFAGDLLRPKK